jgi:hypothetical protein
MGLKTQESQESQELQDLQKAQEQPELQDLQRLQEQRKEWLEESLEEWLVILPQGRFAENRSFRWSPAQASPQLAAATMHRHLKN